jgi:Tol biopolymer transport system component/tRNA A-37 threonylcarbamoyl transferase component Bud32
MRFSAGTRFGTYEISDVLGAGGMGEVYRARDSRLGREVAIKVLSSPFAADPERLARFEREARVLASLNHPGIGAIYGLELASVAGEASVPGLVLELVEGDTLSDQIRRAPIPLVRALTLARHVVDALDAAHERGVVHRDLKPANIKITAHDTIKILDFGLAKALADDSSADTDPANLATTLAHETRAGMILGTAAYMSPEQARGQTIDKRTDIWAFGCVLFEMLTGARAFDGASATDAIAAVLTRDPEWTRLPPATPPRVRALLERCLTKDVRTRLRDIADARLDLAEAPALPAPAAAVPVSEPPLKQTSFGWLLPAGVGLAVLGVAAGWILGRRADAPGAPTFDRIIRLVSTPAHEFAPAMSPDGKWVAYVSNARGPTDVWVKFVAGGDPVNLTASSGLTVFTQDAIGPLAISPDGSQIAFTAQEPMQLSATYVIPAPLGGPARRLLAVGNVGVQWSPDGKRLAYVKSGGPLGDALMLADVDGQHEVELVKRQGGRHLHWVRWDPSATFVYFNYGFQSANAEQTEIFRAPVAGGRSAERVIATARRAVAPFPSPDGRGLFYAANPDGVDLGLWWRDFESGRETRLTNGVGEYSSPSVSADGKRLVGTVWETRESLQRLSLATDRPTKLEPITDGFSGDITPSWSPDGSHLAFASSRSGQRTLWAVDAHFSHPTPITTGPALDECPVYSPDGKQIAFVSDRGGRRGIWIVSPEGGTARLVLATDVIDTVDWSPDGKHLVFSAPIGDGPGLMTVDVATGTPTRVPTPGAATRPAWSPRDDVIAYVEPRGGTVGAYVRFVTSAGVAVHQEAVESPTGDLAKLQIANGYLAWSPDARRLAAVSLAGALPGAIWMIDVDKATSHKVLDLGPSDQARGVSWSRDGGSLVVSLVQRAGDIFLAERLADRQ